MAKSKRQFATLLDEDLWIKIHAARKAAGHSVPEWLARDPRLTGMVSQQVREQFNSGAPAAAPAYPVATGPATVELPNDTPYAHTAPPPTPLTLPSWLAESMKKKKEAEGAKNTTVEDGPSWQGKAESSQPDVAGLCPHLAQLVAEKREYDALPEEIFPWCADPLWNPGYAPWMRPFLNSFPEGNHHIILDRVEFDSEIQAWAKTETFNSITDGFKNSAAVQMWLEDKYVFNRGKQRIEPTAEGWKLIIQGESDVRFVYRWEGSAVPDYDSQFVDEAQISQP